MTGLSSQFQGCSPWYARMSPSCVELTSLRALAPRAASAVAKAALVGAKTMACRWSGACGTGREAASRRGVLSSWLCYRHRCMCRGELAKQMALIPQPRMGNPSLVATPMTHTESKDTAVHCSTAKCTLEHTCLVR